MSVGTWETVVPLPRRILPQPGAWRVPAGGIGIGGYGSVGEATAGWLASGVCADGSSTGVEVTAGSGGAVHLGLVRDLVVAGVLPPGECAAGVFPAEAAEQGYVLEVSPERIILAAPAAPGLQHAAATLLQALRQAPAGELPSVRIEDWPEIPLRAADWLLNAEINRWGLERGDGEAALLARMERKLDLAARLKLNLVWFDGFGWDPDRTPGYAALVQRLSRRARERHIRLAHAGYGGGYGFAYQRSFIYNARYHGRLFENRDGYPDGPVYDCIGHPDYPASWRFGTCLSNEALAELKVAELVHFVRTCHPGLLYIHDIDTGTFGLARQGWLRRCPRCRSRWPSDEMEAPDGAAGAYAQWYRRLSTALNQVCSVDGTYCAARDCEIVFVGPVYTDADGTGATWREECGYLGRASALVGPCPNLQFGIREQVIRDDPGQDRVAQLRRALDEAGNGHGVFVVSFTGGDNYYGDTLVPPGAALQGAYGGARTSYIKHLGAVFEPAQALCAEYAWNPTARGCETLPVGHEAGLGTLRRIRGGQQAPPDWLGPAGVIQRACAALYGPAAAGPLARAAVLGLGAGLPPVATAWGALSREVGGLLASPPTDAAQRLAYWRERARVTQEAEACAASAMAAARTPSERDDLAWLRTRFRIGERFCAVLASCWQWRLDPTAPNRLAAQAELRRAFGCLQEHVGQDVVDPVGGDVATWGAILAKLAAWIVL